MQVNPNTLVGTADGDGGATVTAPATKTNVSPGPADNPTPTPSNPSGQGREAPAAKPTPSISNWFEPTETWKPGNGSEGGKPGKRLYNPLGSLASYTYQLSLYMITPDAYEMFVAGGRKNIHQFTNAVSSDTLTAPQSSNSLTSITGAAYLIAQSGGVGPTEKRIPGLEYDLYIDKCSFTHWVSPKSTGGATINTDFDISLIEPYGFSFVSKLRNANDELINYAKGVSLAKEPTKQFFILGIKFLGWDQSGTQVKGSDVFNGQPVDPNAGGSTELFETYYDLVITEFKFKLDGKATVYNIKAASTQTGLGANVKRGFLNTAKSVTGRTVHEALAGPEGLLTKLNKDQQNLKNAVPINYKIEWIGDAASIAQASLLSDNELNKSKQATAPVTNTKQVNPDTEQKATPQPDKFEIQTAINKSIIETIDFIISRSQWLEDQLSTGYIDDPENVSGSNSPAEAKNSSPEKFKWFNISPRISNITWDSNIKDWAYDITYVIQTYLMPTVDNPYIKDTITYYGPHKRYNYWFTGLNTEITSFSQELNHSYFTSVLGSPPDKTASGTDIGQGNAANSDRAGAPIAPLSIPETMPGAGGNKSQAVKSSVRTSLYDPGAWATAKIDILGDPDYLVQDSVTGIEDAMMRHYDGRNGFTINPTGGQVFIEIDFKEGVDYSSSDQNSLGIKSQGGTMSINESISFGTSVDNVIDPATGEQLIKGIRYMLLSVTNTFSGGSFKQQLRAVMKPLDNSYNALTSSAQNDVSNAENVKVNDESSTQSGEGVVNSPPTDKENSTSGSPIPQESVKPAPGADDDK